MTSSNNFFITGLPRSGTAWLANFLTWGSSFCFHEGLFGIQSIEDYKELLQTEGDSLVGDSDTVLLSMVPEIQQHFPDAKWIFIHRDIGQVMNSCEGIGMPVSGIIGLNHKLRKAIASNIGMVIDFKDIFAISSMLKMWSHLEIFDPFPQTRFEMLKEMQINDGLMPGMRFRRTHDMSLHTKNHRLFRTSL